MAYLSLYRKYRPQFFADVVGQDHVVQTLQNALRSGRVANGYLFCGTRGVAKTTMARILAKGLNCIGSDGSASVSQAEPCNECAPCKAISAGQAVDVVEMDAASNRSVNDIAKLRESVQFGPMENRFKVYIVDEAHQLSSDAKDAFLKTLEEPPANVVFILATTETHAIPITIASRCQRFDFKRGSIGQIGQQISRVLSKENVTMHGDAIIMIARAADGSYRDALSLLDQVLAYKRHDITADDIAEVLGTVKNDLLASTIQKVAESDFAGVFAISEEIFNQGKDVRQFLKTLAARFRDMLFLSSGAKSADDDSTLSDPVLRQQTGQFSPTAMMDALTVVTEAEQETRNSNQHRLLLEMALLKLTKLPTTPKAIEFVSAPAGAKSAVVSIPLAAVEAAILIAVDDSDDETQDSFVEPDDETIAPTADGAHEVKSTANAAEDPDTSTIAMFGLDNEPAKLPPLRPTPPSPSSYQQAAAVEAEERELIASADTGVNGTARPDADDSNQAELQYLRTHWSEAVNHMRVASPSGVPLMNDATPIAQVGQIITIEFANKSNTDKLAENPRRLEFLENAVNKTLRKPPKTFKVRPVLRGAPDLTNLGKSNGSTPKAKPVPDDSPSDLLDEVIAVFGGKIIEDDHPKR
jgi:DNA polymerase III subunit gamma/tau